MPQILGRVGQTDGRTPVVELAHVGISGGKHIGEDRGLNRQEATVYLECTVSSDQYDIAVLRPKLLVPYRVVRQCLQRVRAAIVRPDLLDGFLLACDIDVELIVHACDKEHPGECVSAGGIGRSRSSASVIATKWLTFRTLPNDCLYLLTCGDRMASSDVRIQSLNQDKVSP